MSRYLNLAAFAAAMVFASAASADEISARCGGIKSYRSDAFLCESHASVSFRSDGPEIAYAMRISTPASACADTSFVVYRDRAQFRRDAPAGIAYTYRLRPGQSQTVSIGAGYAEGNQALRVGAIRYRGECQGRAAMSWRAAVLIAPFSS